MRRALPCAWFAGRSRTRNIRRATGWRCEFHLLRPRTGEKVRKLAEILDLTTRAAHEQELFPPADWEFIQWLAETHASAQRRRGDAGAVGPGAAALAGALGAHAPARAGRRRGHAAAAGVPRPGRGADAAPGERRRGAGLHAPADAAGRQSLSVERGAVLQPPPAAGAGGQHLLPAAQRAAAGVAASTGPASRRCRCAS